MMPRWVKLSLLALLAFRLWNAFHFNPFWGYDGGGHLDYIFSLIGGHFPDLKTNYLAWHEPLYYLLMTGVSRLHSGLRMFELAQAGLSLALAALSWSVVTKLTDKPWARGIAWVSWNLLAPVTLASTMVTNELLNYFWIVLILNLGLSEKWRARSVELGVICGLALLTKMTAIVAVIALIVARAAQMNRTNWFAETKKVAVIASIAGLLYAPWLSYRALSGNDALAINNTEYLAPDPLALDSRAQFFAKFDKDIFTFPFWYSGGRGFWSMLYADTFWDYYGMMQNRDQLAALPSTEKIQTDHNGGEVSRFKLEVTKPLPWLALPLALVMLIGAWQLLKKPFELPTLLSGALFAALIYFAYRYPFYDKGIVKSIFIGPAFLPLLAAGFVHIQERAKKPVLLVVFTVIVGAYLSVLLVSTLVR
jgi:hypothetical protein